MKTASSSTKLKATDSLDSRPAIYGRTGFLHETDARLRRYLKKERSKRAPDDVRILFYSDNLDETNGIANNLRNVIPYMRTHGMKAFLAGSAFNTRPCGVIENSYCILLPRMFSMEQLGYANSELAIPRISPALRLLKRLAYLLLRTYRRHQGFQPLPYRRPDLRKDSREGKVDARVCAMAHAHILLACKACREPLR